MAWFKKLLNCLEAATKREGHTFACLSTVKGPESGKFCGRPSNRTVNIRNADANQLIIVSDMRSGKVDDVLNGTSPHGEVCWWFPELQTQFRISGRLEIISSGDERDGYWKELGSRQRQWWAFPSPGSERNEEKYERDDRIVDGEMPPYFCICKLHIDFVDAFDRRPNPMLREQFEKDDTTGEWTRLCVHC